MPDDRCNKFVLQEAEYEFPYHHIPYLSPRGYGVRHRALAWGFEYLCYLRHLQELVNEIEPASILDVGCGDGRFLGMLGSHVPRRAGVDLSARAVSFARAFHPDIEFTVGDIRDVRETFDAVTAIEVLEHVADEGAFVRELEGRAKAGGHVILSVPTTVVPLQEKHYRHYDAASLRSALAASRARLAVVRLDWVVRESLLLRAFTFLTWTRLWFVDITPLSRLVWLYVWRRLRHAGARDGKHLVALLRREG